MNIGSLRKFHPIGYSFSAKMRLRPRFPGAIGGLFFGLCGFIPASNDCTISGGPPTDLCIAGNRQRDSEHLECSRIFRVFLKETSKKWVLMSVRMYDSRSSEGGSIPESGSLTEEASRDTNVSKAASNQFDNNKSGSASRKETSSGSRREYEHRDAEHDGTSGRRQKVRDCFSGCLGCF